MINKHKFSESSKSRMQSFEEPNRGLNCKYSVLTKLHSYCRRSFHCFRN